MSKAITLLLVSLFAASALALTPAERAIVSHIGEVNKRQAAELQDVRAKLVWVDKELKDTEPKIQKLGADLDKYMGLYASEHEERLKQDTVILRLWIAIGIMALLMGAYAFAKFYLHLPI